MKEPRTTSPRTIKKDVTHSSYHQRSESNARKPVASRAMPCSPSFLLRAGTNWGEHVVYLKRTWNRLPVDRLFDIADFAKTNDPAAAGIKQARAGML